MAIDPPAKPQKEINHLKMQVKRLNKDKDKSFPGLGQATYQAFLQGRLSDAALLDVCGQIRAIDAQIEQTQAEIARLQSVAQQMKVAGVPLSTGAVLCPSCGAPSTPGLKFCANCGTPQQAVAAPQPGPSCPACGSPLTPGTRFCGECGKPVEAAPAPAQPAGAAQVAPPPPPPPAPQAAPPPPPAAEADQAPIADAATPTVGEAPAAEPKCPACGAVIDEQGGAFCGECGARLP